MMPVHSMARALPVEAVPTDQAFATFGTIIRRPDLYGERRFYSEWFGGDGLSPVLHTNRVAPSQLPAELRRLERHPHAAQCFIPLDVERYLVTVAPARPDMSPDVENMRSFIFPRDLGVVYGRGVWHAPASALDRPGTFAVLMWRGRHDDDEFHDIPAVTLANGNHEP
jgi:ureidoglycolate lyase